MGQFNDIQENVSSSVTSGAASPIWWIKDSASGATAISKTMAGLQLSSVAMSTTAKYIPAIKFMSTDPNFTTDNPKLLAGIFGVATETYAADTDSGMAIDIYTCPDDVGASGMPVRRMRIGNNGNVYIGDGAANHTLEVSGTFGFVPSADVSMSAGTGLTVTNTIMRVVSSGAGDTTITANPSIVDASDGRMVIIQGTSDTQTVTFNDGNGLALAGGAAMTLGKGDTLTLYRDAGDDLWYEVARSNN